MSQQLNAYALSTFTEKNMPPSVSIELLCHTETEDTAMHTKMQKKLRQNWRNDHGVLCYELIDTNGTTTKYQYKRMPNETEGERWYYQNKKRSWQEVQDFDVTYDTVNFALTGRSY